MSKLLKKHTLRWHCICSLHACIWQLVVTVSPQPPESSWKSVLVRASCAFFPHLERVPHSPTQKQGTYSAACVSVPLRFNRGAGALLENHIIKKRTQQFTVRYRLQFGELVKSQSAHALFRDKRRSSELLSSTDALPGEPVCSGHSV